MKIGILQTDSVLEQLQGEFGNYPEMFINLLQGADKEIEFTTFDVRSGVYPPRLDYCDAYLITGSRSSVYDTDEWIRTLEVFVRELHAQRCKLLGICFGHQLVARALGGETRCAEPGWGVGVHASRVIVKEPFMEPERDEFSLLVSHKDQVTSLPRDAVHLAGSEFCPHSMFRVDQHILTFQGHPEFGRGYSRKLMDMRVDLIGEEKYVRGVESLCEETHEVDVAHWIIRFLRG